MTCACGNPLGERNVTGLCRACNGRKHLAAYNADRAALESRNERRAHAYNDPERRRKLLVHLAQHARNQLAWCPLEYRDQYRAMTRSGLRLKAKTARAIIHARISEDAQAYARTGQLQQSRRGG